MFEATVTRLMSGQFICQVSDPVGYEFLTRNDLHNGKTNSEDVNQFLSRVGMKLSTTQSGTAFYCSHLDIDDQGKKAAKALFAELKNNLRLLVDFFKLVMDTTGNDFSVNPGQKLDLNRLGAVISQNQNLVEALRKVALMCKGVGGDTDRGRLEKVVKKLKLDGYLIDVNKEQDIYQFTGKVEFFHDTLQFLMQHDQISEEDEAFNDKVDSQ